MADDLMRELAPILAEDDTPPGIGEKARLPRGHWYGERAARDVLDLARRGRAHSSLGGLITKQGSHAVQSAAAIALAGTMQAWATIVGKPVDQVTPSAFGTE